MVLSCYIKSFDYTDFISKMQQNAPYCVLLKKKFWGGGGGQIQTPLPLLVSRGLACMENIDHFIVFLLTYEIGGHFMVVVLTCENGGHFMVYI